MDPDILLLGAYYIAVIFFYLLFEMIPINYRPIPIAATVERYHGGIDVRVQDGTFSCGVVLYHK